MRLGIVALCALCSWIGACAATGSAARSSTPSPRSESRSEAGVNDADATTTIATSADPPTCPLPWSLCGTVCRYPATDAANCGSCGHACASGEQCVGGACESIGGPRIDSRHRRVIVTGTIVVDSRRDCTDGCLGRRDECLRSTPGAARCDDDQRACVVECSRESRDE